MTPQESQTLQRFLSQLTQAHVSAKDPDAQAMITKAVAQQPDAAYLLVQRALLLERALQQARSQRPRVQEERATAPPPARAPQVQAPPQTAVGTNSGWGSFLGNAATTAAGIAGGAFLFQGLEDMFVHRGSGFSAGGAPTETVENVTVNEYSDDTAAPTFDSADDRNVNDYADDDDRWEGAESPEFTSADDSDAELDEGDFDDDDSSWT